MSLYFDAVGILTAPASTGGSFKNRIYNSRTLKASPAQVYALITEASKWDLILKEVIDAAGILKLEPKLTPHLAILLVHDHLLAKNGIAAPANHPLRQAVERHKARLRGEFVKARVRRACASIPDLKDAVLREKNAANGVKTLVYPRWVRINNIRSDLNAQLTSTFANYTTVTDLAALVNKSDPNRILIDPHIPDLVALPPGLIDFPSSPAYRAGELILQDKASCFPAYLLLGDDDSIKGDLVDGCAAPGNKTTHMASLLAKHSRPGAHIFSLDASLPRAKTLQKMVAAAGANPLVTVLPGQDFLALDPNDPRFENVSALLLDPSCSGSGIIGRDDVPKLLLPETPSTAPPKGQGKKRKRGAAAQETQPPASTTATENSVANAPSATDETDLPTAPMTADRLLKLSNLQTRIVEHALSFPAATRITYSTCSTHLLENEAVVSRVLASDVAKARGWRAMRRDEQPVGLRSWVFRGVREEGGKVGEGVEVSLSDEDLEGCLRCWPGDEEGLGGFFVAGFVRDESLAVASDAPVENGNGDGEGEEEGDDWEGFSD